MVWSTAQSALYKAVDDYNSRGINVKNYRENTLENCTENCNNFREKMPEKSRENCSDNSNIFREKLCGNNLKNSDDFAALKKKRKKLKTKSTFCTRILLCRFTYL